MGGVVCALAALCYAEFASTVPVAGSAYTFSYATFGEFIAWIIGWDLVLEYALKPVLSALKAQEILNGVFADDSQVSYTETGVALTPALEQRLHESLEQFHAALVRRPQPLTPELLADRIGQARWGI